jgi:hypothetical protein
MFRPQRVILRCRNSRTHLPNCNAHISIQRCSHRDGFEAITLCSSKPARSFRGGDMHLRNIGFPSKTAFLTTEECRQVPHSVNRPLPFCCDTTDLHVEIASETRRMTETSQQCCQLHVHVHVHVVSKLEIADITPRCRVKIKILFRVTYCHVTE